jgi:sugar lactone lactonase YvrE
VWLAVVVAAGAAAFTWWLRRTPAPPPTAGAWTAVVTTIAGSGIPGVRNGAADGAQFSDPFGVSVDREGVILIADAGESNRIRRVYPDARVETLAGGSEGYADGPSVRAAFHTPSGVAAAADGTVYVADTGNHTVRRIRPDGVVDTVAGGSEPGWSDGQGTAARFDGPIGIALAGNGDLLVADAYNDAVRRIDQSGAVTTIAGGAAPGHLDGPAETARFDTPCGVTVAPDGAVLVADTGNGVIRRVHEGHVTTLWLTPLDASSDISLVGPVGIAASEDGAVYVTDRRGRVLHVQPDGRARVLAGSQPGFADGSGAAARFHTPRGVAVDRQGALVVADAANFLIRRLAPAGLYPPDAPRSPLEPSPGLPAAFLAATPLPWPVDPQFEWHEVAGTMGEARGSAFDARERFHAGIDIRADDGALVRVVRSAKVDAPVAALGFDTLNESVAIGPFTYVHLRVGRDGRGNLLDPGRFRLTTDETGAPLRIRVRRGTRFAMGDAIGTVNRFRHVHLNAGTAGREVNPLTLRLVDFTDTVAPEIARRGVTLLDEAGLPAPRVTGRYLVTGRVRIVADAWDRVDGNAARRRLGLHRLGYQVLAPDGTPMPGFESPRVTIDFERLPPQPGAAGLVYAAGSGISVYGRRRTRFLYTVTNEVRDGRAVEGFWDTGGLPPGPYTLRILAADAAGNQAMAGRDVGVMVVPAGVPAPAAGERVVRAPAASAPSAAGR